LCLQQVRISEDDDGVAWRSLASFLAENGLLMSHGYCPECVGEGPGELDAELPLTVSQPTPSPHP
jgi:hypothetical protein